MRCLVTGASGHLGSSLVQLLVERGQQVAAVVRTQSLLDRLRPVMDQVEIIHGDLGDYPQARPRIMQFHPEVAFHLAWTGVTAENREHVVQVTRNVAGSLELWEIIQAAGCSCWIGVGSQAEYGRCDLPLHEEIPPHPTTAYGLGKWCTGLLTQKACESTGMRFVWVRLLATYGPGDDPRHLIPTVIRELLSRRRPALTAGDQEWDYLYVRDAAEALYCLSNTPQASGFYTLGSGEARPVREIAESIRNLIDPHLSLGFGDLPRSRHGPKRLQADISRLRMATGWRPSTSWEEGLEKTIQWHKAGACAAGPGESA